LNDDALDAIIAAIRAKHPEDWNVQGIRDEELAALKRCCQQDSQRFRRLLKRRLYGEPLSYVLGWFDFRGRRFRIDRRAYITDPEVSPLVDVVVEAARRALRQRADAVVAEVGTGCGSLAISVLKEAPALRVVALDIDASALSLARENAALHGVDLDILESDYFASWGDRPPPDIVFANIPYGDRIYGAQHVRHYLAMPPASVFPLSGKTDDQKALLAMIGELGWTAEIFINCGLLPEEDIRDIVASSQPAFFELLQPGPRILHCRMKGETPSMQPDTQRTLLPTWPTA
jgi:hypothetical protein